jgi:hypothetical protein
MLGQHNQDQVGELHHILQQLRAVDDKLRSDITRVQTYLASQSATKHAISQAVKFVPIIGPAVGSALDFSQITAEVAVKARIWAAGKDRKNLPELVKRRLLQYETAKQHLEQTQRALLAALDDAAGKR